MKKNIILLMLILTSISMTAAQVVTIDGFKVFLEEGNNAILISVSNDNSGIVSIPENISVDGNEYNIVQIDKSCFKDCDWLISISLPSTIKSLPYACFSGCTSLTNVTLPSSISSLPSECFYGCSNLKTFTIPNSITYLGSSCFCLCTKLGSITIPASINALPFSCFSGCHNLTSIKIAASVIKIEGYCFQNCKSLSTICRRCYAISLLPDLCTTKIFRNIQICRFLEDL